jgi:hypothetical protein
MQPLPRPVPFILLIVISLAGCTSTRTIQEETVKQFTQAVERRQTPFTLPRGTRIDSVWVDHAAKRVTVFFNKEFSSIPFRRENVDTLYAKVRSFFREPFQDYSVSIRTLREPIEQLIPNYYRASREEYDRRRLPREDSSRPAPLTENLSRQFKALRGLYNRNIGLWHSHGWYYEKTRERWEWQRPRLFESVEDLGPMSFTLPYLIPMLENAGAMVFVPRERDIQRNEAIVDNDSKGEQYIEGGGRAKNAWRRGKGTGFAVGSPPYAGHHNPFTAGTHRVIAADSVSTATATWIPEIPATGEYAVSVSYASSKENVPDAQYVVYHAGGRTEFRVNQQIGGSTWVYLGTFRFPQGLHPERGRVVLTNRSRAPGKIVSADAVRFGGGMGVIMRNGSASGRPKFVEAARYYLQFSGMPDTLVYSSTADSSDYRDDIVARPEYLNYLRGAPYGPNGNRNAGGLGIPIDLSLAFHTDAGITTNDTTIGTLSIYSIEAKDSALVFPDSVSRLANRDLADIMQTQIVDDIRALYDPAWTRRSLRNAEYSEAVRPNFPSVLLELLSHQNLTDMRFMLDPRYRFDVSRAIYKAILRFLSVQYATPYVVEPLPVTHFAAVLLPDGSAHLSWRPRVDPLEQSAIPDRFIVYTRIDDGGFDNGTLVHEGEATLPPLEPGQIYSYYVTAVNDGGESFPSEILSVCRTDNTKKPILIVNGFTRISGPATVESAPFSGVLSALDAGVPDRHMVNFTGPQYDYLPTSPFRSNDAPGFGASYADYEGSVVAGNTFDYPFIHGKAILSAGNPFVSCSKDAVVDGIIDLKAYRCVDLILGKERETRWQRAAIDSLRGVPFQAFPPALRESLQTYTSAGGNLLVSGAYVGTDLHAHMPADSSAARFGNTVLKIRWVTGHASRNGTVVSALTPSFRNISPFRFSTEPSDSVYQVESADAIEPVEGGKVIFRFGENSFSAGTAFSGSYRVVVLGFPFETVAGEQTRESIMQAVLGFFTF